MRTVAAVLVAMTLLTGCGAGEKDTTLPPLTEEPSFPLFDSSSPAPTRAKNDLPARTVLQKILRGAGRKNVRVCGWVTPGFARTALGVPCPRWVRTLRPADRAKLRLVKVPTAVGGDTSGEWIIEASSLVWPAGAPAATPRTPRYLMRLTGPRWMLSQTG